MSGYDSGGPSAYSSSASQSSTGNEFDQYTRAEEYVWRWVRSSSGGSGSNALGPYSTTLKNLQHYTKYSVSVRAVNEVGTGPMAVPISVTTREAGEILNIIY